MTASRTTIWISAFAAAVLAPLAVRADESGDQPHYSAEQIEFFEKEVRPLLVEHCQKCHGSATQKGNLRLDSREAAIKGGDTGPALLPGKPEESLLVDAVSYGELYQMPPSGKLAEKQIAVLRRWVEQGAPWGGEADTTVAANQEKPVFDLAERAKHWAFQPLAFGPPPTVRDGTWPQSEVDQYLLSRVEAVGLAPVAAADKRRLLRRATFDLIGLPPVPGEMADFLRDERPDAFERVIDRLLASPHFGERWARHWLDLVRYAESKGHEFDYTLPNAWQYRDYVIRAFNADVPYDQFVIEHVAGDLVAQPRRHPERGSNESVLGTGFWFLGEEVHSPVELAADELDRTDNKIDVFSKTFLALTVACARCHDHKFDAISTKDYYALAGYLLSSGYRQAPFDAVDVEGQIAGRLAELRSQQRATLLGATQAAMRPTLDRTGELLLATRDVLESAGTDEGAAADAARAKAIEAIARERRMAVTELARWVDAVRQAIADTASPLHAWALAATAQGQNSATPAAQVGPLLARIEQTSTVTVETRVAIDFGNLAPQDWRQDGFAFGKGPAMIGDVAFGASADRPVTRVWSMAAAVSDPFWDSAALAPGVERESGRLSWLQSGRMLRTPTFTLVGGKIYYLASGSGYAYAVVHSHRLNNGPLHGALVREWQSGDDFQWIEHDLSAYRGQRVHIEFSPRQPGEVKDEASPVLAIAKVVESERSPAVASLVVAALPFSDSELASWQALAAAYQQRLTHAAEQLAADALSVPADAALADWLLRHMDLFVPPGSESRQNLASAAQPFIDAQAQLAAQLPRSIHTAPAMLDGSGVDECVMLRGNFKTPGEVVPRRYLEALGGVDHKAPADGSGRLDLARQMTDPAHPLVARVIVNRVWQHLFGRGLVASVDNFGVLGEAPTHRELLDRLAGQFMADGWSIKRLIRRLMLTSSYRLSSRPSEQARKVDPNNLLLSHAAVKRLEAEAIRDSVLAVSGRLDRRMFGPSVPVYLSEFMQGRGRPAGGPLDGDGRRSVYLSVRRNFLSTFFLAFDYPVPFTAVGRRSVSNVPAQALTMMNSPFVAGEARRWAQAAVQKPADPAARIVELFWNVFGRPPSEAETHAAASFLTEQRQAYAQSDDVRAWTDLCHVLINAKEFIFVE
ncbi:MAG TPA: PSD1 and planctomycete cytochrome C domain-containing protein [Pirellulales bacterium]|nr:PSD1 and planctomycete cytochrome C domain-containing protein [Pirellulales bacterium]